MSSMISYFNDRVLTPEMMRAMIILYIGPHARPDFTTDFLLSPLLAPESYLAQFPKTYFLTGERDPMVDDTVIFAGRLRQAKWNTHVQRKEMGMLGRGERWDERNHVEVFLVPGVSHGFIQFAGAFPEAWRHMFRCARWIEEIFGMSDDDTEKQRPKRNSDSNKNREANERESTRSKGRERYHVRRRTAESSGDEDRPLEMSSISGSISSAGKGNGSAGTGSGKSRNNRREDKGFTSALGEDADVGSTPERVSAMRRVSLTRRQSGLDSEEDILKRRMRGLMMGMMANDEDADEGMVTP